jgi:hypothetical protein
MPRLEQRLNHELARNHTPNAPKEHEWLLAVFSNCLQKLLTTTVLLNRALTEMPILYYCDRPLLRTFGAFAVVCCTKLWIVDFETHDRGIALVDLLLKLVS